MTSRPEGEDTIRLMPFVALYVAICCVRPAAKKIIFTGLTPRVYWYLTNVWAMYQGRLDAGQSHPLGRHDLYLLSMGDEADIFTSLVYLWCHGSIVKRRVVPTPEHMSAVSPASQTSVVDNRAGIWHGLLGSRTIFPDSASVLDRLRPGGWAWEEITDEVARSHEWEFKCSDMDV
ncbi:hypothetical protein EJ05DRAFT_475210 [Pseudovirgaria hyperparasitica]|uniref:Uncharacterized protein n=1 Tax=Pseudovirgaria hyperparasitica TaxID=470096 RepID=A0A6A6W8U4_9PEZI|nr:uncharacterized protein EJ05DRAFT_475210 [Pseudovirgaria hyperparasitica]KAF2758975.1 hypothetical protein EJ05DRAFT_475210 [Pseudovirgaria hyperparasitica]